MQALIDARMSQALKEKEIEKHHQNKGTLHHERNTNLVSFFLQTSMLHDVNKKYFYWTKGLKKCMSVFHGERTVKIYYLVIWLNLLN